MLVLPVGNSGPLNPIGSTMRDSCIVVCRCANIARAGYTGVPRGTPEHLGGGGQATDWLSEAAVNGNLSRFRLKLITMF
jgi:hypothetical protein